MRQALHLAIRTKQTVYDSFYLALAVLQRCQMVTADRRFHDALQRGPFRPSLRWVEDDL